MGNKRLLAAVACAAGTAIAALPAAAKTCKEPLKAEARTTMKLDEAGRAKRATELAIKRWGEAARAKYGFAFRFWIRADNSASECKHTPKSTLCTVTATPCRLI
jgi:hypothetical protein